MITIRTRTLKETVGTIVAMTTIPITSPFSFPLMPNRMGFENTIFRFYHFYAAEWRNSFRFLFVFFVCNVWIIEPQEPSSSFCPSINHRAFWAVWELVLWSERITRRYQIDLPIDFFPLPKCSGLLERTTRTATLRKTIVWKQHTHFYMLSRLSLSVQRTTHG